MKNILLLLVGMMLSWGGNLMAVEEHNVDLDNLVRNFQENPADHNSAIQLLKELNRRGKSGQEVVDRYFKTQKETDYFKDYNWTIVRDYVNDINAPQLRFVFKNQDKFIARFSKDDVFQKLDDVLVGHLEKSYQQNRSNYEQELNRIKELGYEHYDVVYDYFKIRELRAARNAEDYFYKARKLFRYFPENRKMIKEITAGALEIMEDVSRLKVIQLWAGKTVESKSDFDAIYNYVKISRKCGFNDIARKYADIASRLADKSGSLPMQQQAGELMRLFN